MTNIQLVLRNVVVSMIIYYRIEDCPVFSVGYLDQIHSHLVSKHNTNIIMEAASTVLEINK